MQTTSDDRLTDIFDDLVATPSSRLPYQQNVLLRSFVLKRADGNVVVYNSPGVSECATEIRELGTPSRLLINHAHESMSGQPDLDVPIWVHEEDRRDVEATMSVAGVFSNVELIDDDVLVVPTPGHTAGTTSYLWDSGSHRYLFTGDFVWVEDGEWKAVVLDDSLRASYVESLVKVRDLDFDVLVPWGVTEGHSPAFVVRDDAEKRARISAIIDRVTRGENR